jgi:hypothetical protein
MASICMNIQEDYRKFICVRSKLERNIGVYFVALSFRNRKWWSKEMKLQNFSEPTLVDL